VLAGRELGATCLAASLPFTHSELDHLGDRGGGIRDFETSGPVLLDGELAEQLVGERRGHGLYAVEVEDDL